MDSSDGPTGSNQTESQMHHEQFWERQMETIRNLKNSDFKKAQELPLARIKKIMKLDEDVKMISAEAPVLFAKAAEIFITELSLRAWLHTEENKRRTLQRNDIAMAITKYDQFDFLIDIVPRDELKPPKRSEGQLQQTAIPADQVQYYFSVPQQGQNQGSSTVQVQNTAPTVVSAANTSAGQLATTQPQVQIQTGSDGQTTLINSQGQVIPIQLPAGTNLQQVVANASGDNQQIQFAGNQLQYVRQSSSGNQQQTAGQEFITQLSGGQIFQIQQVPGQTQAGNLGQQVFLQQALPETTTTSTEQQ
ncbi:nuclear transcription factor Y subunit gamma-like isoform X2 [Lytechinus pictus]|uniref:nuclear transcription factor Y subunit gamma-like isoform X2 n=1 Tax=Lytechinus pictus TaxID=7653 RepID=UPI00240E8F4A|nr:nuclear transcription factor Y subunit gamma-like isoform X2 [Lytechinus pictus]XP_054771997.1 nuclear transcription factor Y subunit gamma-like isoform X2 [Lytechinus pictus]